MTKLYEITSAMTKVKDVIDDQEALTEYLDGLEMQLKDKATNILKVMKNYSAPVKAIDEEIERLKNLKASYNSKVENLMNYVGYNMEINKIEKIETDIVTFSFRKSSAVKITDETKLPKKFVITVETQRPDKDAIKKEIKDGKRVPGAEIEVRKNLQVK